MNGNTDRNTVRIDGKLEKWLYAMKMWTLTFIARLLIGGTWINMIYLCEILCLTFKWQFRSKHGSNRWETILMYYVLKSINMECLCDYSYCDKWLFWYNYVLYCYMWTVILLCMLNILVGLDRGYWVEYVKMNQCKSEETLLR